MAPAGLDMARWFAVIEREPLLRARWPRRCRCPSAVLQRVVGEVYKRLAFHRPGGLDPLIASTFASHFADRATTGRLMATGRRLIGELRDPFRLEAIDCPVLLVWGRQDVMVFQTGAERVLGRGGRVAQLVVIEDCGHCPQLESPDRLAELLLDFPAADATAIAS